MRPARSRETDGLLFPNAEARISPSILCSCSVEVRQRRRRGPRRRVRSSVVHSRLRVAYSAWLQARSQLARRVEAPAVLYHAHQLLNWRRPTPTWDLCQCVAAITNTHHLLSEETASSCSEAQDQGRVRSCRSLGGTRGRGHGCRRLQIMHQCRICGYVVWCSERLM